MKLIVGHFYIIVFDVKGKILTYHCQIDELADGFVTLTDKYGKQVSYNQNIILSFEEVENGGS